MVFNKTEEQEKEYLRQIINIINNSVNNTDKSVKEHVDTLQEYKEYLWSNKDIDPHEIRSMRESILQPARVLLTNANAWGKFWIFPISGA